MKAPTSYLGQKVNAIRNINNALQQRDSPPNDYTIVAVAVMTLFEAILTIF
jgi:hypothetical protein